MLLWWRPRRLWGDLKKTSVRCRWLLAVNVVLAVAIPTLLFLALEVAPVTNVILLSRVEPAAFALFSIWFFGASRWMYMRSDLLIAAAAVLQALSACLSKRLLELMSREALVFVRTFLSAVVFYAFAVYLYGFHHFAEAFGPRLWVVMAVYALLLVLLAQMTWFKALDGLPTTSVANWVLISPLLGMLFAFLILGEVPSVEQGIAAVVILTGMFISRSRGEPARDPERSLAAA